MHVSRLALLASLGFMPVVHAQPLPTDPTLKMGTLENGMRYIVRHNALPPGRIGFFMHVSTGSLNETDRQRGIAHYLEHMAFNGSENFPPGSVIPLFQSMGMSFGQHQNAFTSFDQTCYQLMLPDVKPETVGKGLLFLADVAGRLKLLPDEIEKERQIIIEEKRTRAGGMQRIGEYVLERRMPGSLIGQRSPIGTEETILGVNQGDFQDYYGRWYVPSNMTIMAVGDLPEDQMIAAIKEAFSSIPAKGQMPVDQDPRITPIKESRAIVASDKEVVTASLDISRYEPPLPPLTTVESLRRELVDQLATDMFDRRMADKIAKGEVSFQSGGAGVGSLFRVARTVSVSAGGKPADWKNMLNEIGRELQRARLHGFAQQELDDVVKETLAGAKQSIEREKTLPSQAFLGMINNAVANGAAITSSTQDLELMEKLLPTITLQEINETFTKTFDPSVVTYTLTLPSSEDVPTEEMLVKLGNEALAQKPDAETLSDRPTSMLSTTLTPGTIVEQSTHEPSQVVSGWLSNGVRFNYRFMDYRKDDVTFSILLAGGEILEDASTRGLSQAGAIAWSNNHRATASRSATQIRDLMTGKNADAGGRTAFDQMTVSAGGNAADIESALQLAHLMLTEPVVSEAGLKFWKDGQKRLVEARKVQLELVFGDAVTSTLYPKDEIRRQPLTIEQIDRVTADAATQWLRKSVAAAPIEVTIVGDLPKERALELLTKYIGSLPEHPRISEQTLDDRRKMERPVGPTEWSKKLATQTNKALFMSGFYGPDMDNVSEARVMAVASRLLSTKMIERVREDKALAYSPQAQSSPGREIPGFGTFHLVTQTAPEKIETLNSVVTDIYSTLATNGPTQEELEVAKKQLLTNLDEQMREPQFWSRSIAGLTYRGRHLDDIIGEPEAINAVTAEQVKTIFAKYYKPESRFAVWVEPEAVAPADTSGSAGGPSSPTPTAKPASSGGR